MHREATTRSPRDESVRLADWQHVCHDSLEGCLPAVNAYERFVRPLLFSIDPETAHHFTIAFLRRASQVDVALRALKFFEPPPKPKAVFGLTFRNPIGLAAGFDKNGVALPALAALGFGFIEVGTVTAKPQPGNPKPRIFRFPEQAALINRLGFNNEGADAIARRRADAGRRSRSASTSANRGRRRWKGRPTITSTPSVCFVSLPITSC